MKVILRASDSPSEGVWAQRLTANTAKIANLPFLFNSPRYGDVVAFNPETKEFYEVIQDGGYYRTRIISYKGPVQEIGERLQKRGYVVERFAPGKLGITKERRGGGSNA